MRMQKVMWNVAAAGMVVALQAPAIGQQDKAAEVMAAARKAIGGKKLEGMKGFSAQARVQRNIGEIQVGGEVEFLLEMPDKYLRTETRTGGAMAITTSLGFNGSEGLNSIDVPAMAARGGAVTTMIAGPGGAMLGGPNMTPEQQAEMKAGLARTARQDISRLMLGWFGMAHPTLDVTYRYAGEAESPDGRAHVIDVTGPDNFAARLFIDQDTSLPLMLTYQAPRMRMMTSVGPGGAPGIQIRRTAGSEGSEPTEEERQKMREELEKMRAQAPELVEYALFFSDRREVDGIRFPHSIQRAVAGTTDEEWTFSKARVNPKIDAKRFEPGH